MASYSDRMIRAAKLDPRLYEEVEADQGALGQAMGVVILASLAAGIGSAGRIGVGGLLLTTLSSLVGWLFWALLIYLIGAKLLPQPQTRSNLGELAANPRICHLTGSHPDLRPDPRPHRHRFSDRLFLDADRHGRRRASGP